MPVKLRDGQRPPPALSRREQMKRDGITPRLPPVSTPHIIERLLDIGLTQAAGMGAGPLTWAEIVAWQQATSVTLAPWEARLIRRLSVEYLAESRRAESESAAAPWRTELTPQEREASEASLRMVLG